MEERDPVESQRDRVEVAPVGREVEEGLGVGVELDPSQEPVLDGVDTDLQGLGRSLPVQGSWFQETRRNRNSCECASEAAVGGYAGKSCSRDVWGAGMEGNPGNNFVGDTEGRSWGRNGEGREREWAYGRILLRLWDGRTYRMIRIDKPGSTGKGSCERFPGEVNCQCLGPLTNADGSTAWRRQGKAAEGRDSNRRLEEGNMP